MIKKFLWAIGVGILTLALIIAVTILATPKARADFARVELYWTGTPCIEVVQATGWRQWVCNYRATFTAYTGPGMTIGVDPIMGNANYIACAFWLNGDLEYRDSAFAGDGTDVNCILDIVSFTDGSYV